MGENEKGEQYANIHCLVGYNQGYITDFQKMADELRKTFPQAKDSEIRCGKVNRSSRVYGFTIIIWNAHIKKGEYPGWSQFINEPSEYCW